jgi:hypothetical protein
MSLTVNAATSSVPVEPSESPKVSDANTSESKATSSTGATTDTVTISGAALSAAKAAQQEATETPAQTAREANAGDRQAQRLLAKIQQGQAAKH